MTSIGIPHPLWIERSDGTLMAVAHSEPRAAAGHVTYDPATGQYRQLVTGRHGRLEYWYIAPENLPLFFGLPGGPSSS